MPLHTPARLEVTSVENVGKGTLERRTLRHRRRVENEILGSEIPPAHFLYSSPKVWHLDIYSPAIQLENAFLKKLTLSCKNPVDTDG